MVAKAKARAAEPGPDHLGAAHTGQGEAAREQRPTPPDTLSTVAAVEPPGRDLNHALRGLKRMKLMQPPSPVLASLREKGLTAETCDRRVEEEWQKPGEERTFAAIALWTAAAALLRGGDAARGYSLTKEAGKTVATLPPAVETRSSEPVAVVAQSAGEAAR